MCSTTIIYLNFHYVYTYNELQGFQKLLFFEMNQTRYFIFGSTFLSRCSRTLHQSTQQCSKNSNEVQKTNICCTIIIWNCWNQSLQNKLTHRSVKFVDTFSRKNLVEFYFFQTLCKLSNKMFFDKHHRKLGQVYCLYYINNPAKQRATCSIKFNKIFSWKCINKFDRTVCQFILKRLISIILESELCNIICSNKKNSKHYYSVQNTHNTYIQEMLTLKIHKIMHECPE